MRIHVQNQQQLPQGLPDFPSDFPRVCLIRVNTVPAVSNFPDAEDFKKSYQGDITTLSGIYFFPPLSIVRIHGALLLDRGLRKKSPELNCLGFSDHIEG